MSRAAVRICPRLAVSTREAAGPLVPVDAARSPDEFALVVGGNNQGTPQHYVFKYLAYLHRPGRNRSSTYDVSSIRSIASPDVMRRSYGRMKPPSTLLLPHYAMSVLLSATRPVPDPKAGGGAPAPMPPWPWTTRWVHLLSAAEAAATLQSRADLTQNK